MAGAFEKVMFALGKATKAVQDSARERREPAPEPAPSNDTPGLPITLVRCPKCGAYADPAQHTCDKA